MKYEKEILKGLSFGGNAKDIGTKLEISPRTVENHIAILKAVHQAKNTTHLVATAIRKKIIK